MYKHQKKVLLFIQEYRKLCNNSRGPSVRSIQANLGFKSTTTVYELLKRLEKAGLITGTSMANAIQLTDKGIKFLESVK